MISVITSKPVALESPDHIRPYGTAQDNSVHAEFNRRLYELVPAAELRLLDLGCAGGGFVKSVLDDGGFAVGIEGSDWSLLRRRAEWATIPGNLVTADLTSRMDILVGGHVAEFDVITAWEFLEHIAGDGLPAVFANVRRHAATGTLFLGSIGTHADVQGGVSLHQTVRPRAWWLDTFAAFGWTHHPDIEAHIGDHWLRGPHSAQPVPGSFFFAMGLT